MLTMLSCNRSLFLLLFWLGGSNRSFGHFKFLSLGAFLGLFPEAKHCTTKDNAFLRKKVFCSDSAESAVGGIKAM